MIDENTSNPRLATRFALQKRCNFLLESDLDLFEEKIEIRELPKGKQILMKGKICKLLVFVISGSLRLYTSSDRGELTINFFTDRQWVADIESLLNQRPSENTIETAEKSLFASISLEDIHDLMAVQPRFTLMNSLLADLVIPTRHLAARSTKTPDQRYQDLLLNHPGWINRFPQMQIASYLGITPETLSRVRGRLM